MKQKVYAVLISPGNGPYQMFQGWDMLFRTRADAKRLAERASKQDGWSAKVISLTEEVSR